jgi:hypothetical protein
MTSQINPNNINGSYPVAGQDNNSQGFRDNFTNTRTNFSFAAAEITDLQSKAVLKAPLTGSSVVSNNMNGTRLIDAQIQDFSGVVVDLGTTSGSVSINYANGHYQYNVTTTGSISLAFTNFPTATTGTNPWGWITVRLTVSNTAHTLTLPAAVGTGASSTSVTGIQGISSNIITFNETGTYEFVFHSTDGGASIYLHELTRPRNRWISPIFLASSEDLSDAAAASLTKTVSYFDTNGAETATLAAGTDGQVKVLAMSADLGNMVITVTNAGWKTSGTGTITFDDIGDACTLMYTNSKWYCIGNNGCTFA